LKNELEKNHFGNLNDGKMAVTAIDSSHHIVLWGGREDGDPLSSLSLEYRNKIMTLSFIFDANTFGLVVPKRSSTHFFVLPSLWKSEA